MTTQVQPKDKTVTVNGLKIHYLDWGAVGQTCYGACCTGC